MSYKSSKIPAINKNMQNAVALSTVPAGGDASTIIAQTLHRQNHDSKTPEELYKTSDNVSQNNYQLSQCPLLRLSNNLSTSIINTGLDSHAELIEHGILGSENQPDSLSVESCGFPYYRTYKSCGRFDDIVLVKDAGVSCTILDPEKNGPKNSERCSSIFESLLLSQFKIECKDLSDITSKISSCTKDILKNLSLKKRNKDTENISSTQFSKGSELNSSYKVQPVAMQYTDKTGLPCLKLRLVKSRKLMSLEKLKSCSNFIAPRKESKLQIDIESKTKLDDKRSRKIVQRDEPTINKHSLTKIRNQLKYSKFVKTEDRNRINSDTPSQLVKQVRQIYPNESGIVKLESCTCSSSSIYDFLMIRNGKTLLKGTTKEITRSGFQYDHAAAPNCYPISDSIIENPIRNSSKKTIPNFSIYSFKNSVKNTKRKSLANCQKIHHPFQFCKRDEKIIDQRLSRTKSPFRSMINSKSQTVNIRIVKHKRGIL